MLDKLNVSKSGYYDYVNRKPSKQKVRKQELSKKIKAIHEESHEIYGAPKITVKLNQSGIKVSEKYVGNIMREMGIKAHYIRPCTITTKDSDFSSKEEGFVYLTSIMDLYSRKIIAWKLTKTMEVEEVLKCLEEAKRRRKTDNPVVIHSDRGVQFTSKKYYNLTVGMIGSYSKKGNPWDNACIESFHALIKREWLNRKKINDYSEAYQMVFEYIEGFYNTVRIHSHCDYQSPNKYEKNYYQNNLN